MDRRASQRHDREGQEGPAAQRVVSARTRRYRALGASRVFGQWRRGLLRLPLRGDADRRRPAAAAYPGLRLRATAARGTSNWLECPVASAGIVRTPATAMCVPGRRPRRYHPGQRRVRRPRPRSAHQLTEHRASDRSVRRRIERRSGRVIEEPAHSAPVRAAGLISPANPRRSPAARPGTPTCSRGGAGQRHVERVAQLERFRRDQLVGAFGERRNHAEARGTAKSRAIARDTEGRRLDPTKKRPERRAQRGEVGPAIQQRRQPVADDADSNGGKGRAGCRGGQTCALSPAGGGCGPETGRLAVTAPVIAERTAEAKS